MKLHAPTILCLTALLASTAPRLGTSEGEEETKREVRAMLTDFHAAAAEADAERFFGYLAPDAILFGTDAKERWTFEDFRELVMPSFAQGVGWISVPTEQNVFLSERGDVAWFDERLDKPKFGELRATGVLRKTDGDWQVVQLNIALPVPDEVVRDVVKLIRAQSR